MAKPTPNEADPLFILRSHAGSILELAPIPIVEVNSGSHVVSFVNSAFCQLLGKTASELLGIPFREIVPQGRDCESFLDAVYQLQKTDTHVHRDDSAEDHATWLYAMWPALDANESPVRVIIELTKTAAFGNNTTEIHQTLLIPSEKDHGLTEMAEKLYAQLQVEIAEHNEVMAKLRASEMEVKSALDYAEAILRTTPVPFLVVLRSDLRVNKASEAFYANFKVQPADTEGRLIYEIGNGQWNIPKLRELLEEIIPQKNVFNHFEVTHKFADIGVRTMLLNARRMDNAEGAPDRILLSIEDITERKQMEQKLALSNADLTHSNADLAQFASVASHDLQEPLRAVAGCAELLAKDYSEKFDDNANVLIQHILEGTRRMQTMIHDLLEYARINSRSVLAVTTDANAALNLALANLESLLSERDVAITRDPLPSLLADRIQLTQIFQNLIANGVKFCVAQRPEIHIGAECKNGCWIFSVRDNGIGIEPQYFERIFILFQHLHNRTEYPGTGIGLSICKRIVERHHGRIWVESEPGKGSTFFFTLSEPAETTIMNPQSQQAERRYTKN